MLLQRRVRLPALPGGTNAAAGPTSFGLAECDAIVAGVRAAEIVLRWAECSGFLYVFARSAIRAHCQPRLAALCAYAELRRVLLRQDRRLPATSLITAGYSAAEVRHINALIDALAAGSDT